MCSMAATPRWRPLLALRHRIVRPDAHSRLAALEMVLGFRPVRGVRSRPKTVSPWSRSNRLLRRGFLWRQNKTAHNHRPAVADLLWRYGRLRFVRLPARRSWRIGEGVRSLRASQSQAQAAPAAHAPVAFSRGGTTRSPSVAPL